jgi:signal transduction histidine kinase
LRRVVEAHGGSVGLESRLGEGSSFFVDLPAA